MRWWRTDIYTFDQPYTVMCGSGFVTSNDTLQVNTTWGNGVIAFTGSISSLTITSDQGCCSHQVLLFGSGNPIFTGTPDVMKPEITFTPNPVSETLFLSEAGDVSVADITGKVVFAAENTRTIDMSMLPFGIYYVNF